MEKVAWYQMLNRFSLFNTYFAFLDTENYLADGLFIKHQVRVYFGDEFVKPDFPYRIIFCHVRKWDKSGFTLLCVNCQIKCCFVVMWII